MWTSRKMTNKMTLKRDKPNYTNERGYMCDQCGDKGDVYSLSRLLCAICYLLEVAPERVDKLKRKII
jgi:methionyl-tRNA synthetase